MTTLEMTIDDLAALGDGVAHDENGAIFVAGSLTGERVRAEMCEPLTYPRRARLLEVLAPSPSRIEPLCPHAARCGGCRFQHMAAPAYQVHKIGQLMALLAENGLAPEKIEPPFVTRPGTRRRARFAVRATTQGIIVGFNEARSANIVDLQACPVLVPTLEAFISHLRRYLHLWLPKGDKADVQVTVLPDGLDVLLIGGPSLDLATRQDLAALAQALDVAHLSWKKNDRTPAEPIAYARPLGVTFGETRLPFPPGSFLQACEGGEQALIAFAQSAMKEGLHVLDLFCGLGTFGLSLNGAKKRTFVDLDGPAVEALALACRAHPHDEVSQRNLMNDPYSTGNCNDFDFALFDPPRGGAKAQAAQLAKSDVPTVIAISCDPGSFVRDAKILIEGGYRFTRLKAVDQFLFSPHLEVAAEFRK